MTRPFFLVTCEHGGNRIPAPYRKHFRGHEDLLASHRGYDMGALAMARALAASLSAPLHYSTVSRLLIDLNRSPRHTNLYSEITRPLPQQARKAIAQRYYLPYRNAIEAQVEQAVLQRRPVIHISSHSFTPELNGEVRNADIGLLYDTRRPGETSLCQRWRSALKEYAPALRVRMNYPYSGSSDGLTAALRKRFASDLYTGIELELNRLHAQAGKAHWHALRSALTRSLLQALS